MLQTELSHPMQDVLDRNHFSPAGGEQATSPLSYEVEEPFRLTMLSPGREGAKRRSRNEGQQGGGHLLEHQKSEDSSSRLQASLQQSPSVIEKHALRIGRDGNLSKVLVSSLSQRSSGASLKQLTSVALPDGLNLDDSHDDDLERHGEIQRALQKQNVTISQLNLSDLELFGREPELSVLVEGFEEASPVPSVSSTSSASSSSSTGGCARKALGSPKPVVVNVLGGAGTGKTRLCQELSRRSVVQKRRGFVLKGKYESQQRVPYMGIVAALSELPGQVSGKRPLLYPKLRESLKRAVGEEAGLLASLVPALSNLLGVDTDGGLRSSPPDEVYTTRSNRLHYAVRQLFKVICTAEHPLILILDDMQWCDPASLSLLTNAVTDLSLSHLLLVTTCRDDDKNADFPFLELLSTYRDVHQLKVKTVRLANLDQSAVLSIVSTALRSSEEKTFQLSEIVHQKSNGNPLYVLQFLTRLFEDGLLKYNLGLMQWTWEETRVRTRFVMDNVADLTSAKLQSLPIQSQTVLQIASCLGQTFDKEHLEFVIRGPRLRQLYASVEDCWPPELSKCLSDLVGEAIIDFIPELNCYCFVHDLIQDAASRLIPESGRLHVQFAVGRRLLRSLEHVQSPRLSDIYLFRGVELSNTGAHFLVDDEVLGLAKQNLEAGQRAMSKAAFGSALKYMEEGLLRLGPAGWENQSQLALDLACGAVEASYCCGDFASMERHMETVLERDIPIHDKVRCYLTRILSHGAQDRNTKALETGRDVLIKMKVTSLPICPGLHHVLIELVKTKLLLRGFTQRSLLALPTLDDRAWYQAMSIVDMMNAIAYCTDINFFAVMNLRMLRWTIKHGVCRFSPTVFSTYGIILCGLGELKLAHMFGSVALSLSERLHARPSEAKMILGVYGLNAHWTTSLRMCLKPLLYGHKLGMETGEVEIAMYNLSQHGEALLVTAATPLNALIPKMRSNAQLMREYKQEGVRNFYVLALQFALILIGPAENPQELTGEVVVEAEARLNAKRVGNMVLSQFLENYCLQLAYYFGEYELADTYSRRTENFAKIAGGHFLVTRNLFFRGLTALALANKGFQVLRNRRLASRVLSQLTTWYKAGNVNCVHMLQLLQAETAALRNQRARAARYYVQAIHSSSRNGYLNDKALAHERAFLFHLRVDAQDTFWAQNHYTDALQAYCDWNAYEKARHLIRCYGSHVELSNVVASVVSSENLTLEQDIDSSEVSNGEVQQT